MEADIQTVASEIPTPALQLICDCRAGTSSLLFYPILAPRASKFCTRFCLRNTSKLFYEIVQIQNSSHIQGSFQNESNTGTLAMASAVNRRFAVHRLLKLASVLPVVTPRRERTIYTQVKFLQPFECFKRFMKCIRTYT